MSTRKKLIEVALPLQAINDACKPETENPFLRRHPRAVSVWWARAPLVACRAVLLASLIDDPSARPKEFPTEAKQERERQRLFGILQKAATWESSFDEKALGPAIDEIRKSIGDGPLRVIDPFSGRGSIPLEGQRLGLEAFGSDLNPIAALITKSLLEIPSRFWGQGPVNPDARSSLQLGGLDGNEGLIADIQYYASWIHRSAATRLTDVYPPTAVQGDGRRAVTAWIWARSVTCPNPGCAAVVPLVRSFELSKKKGLWVHATPDEKSRTLTYEVGGSDVKARGTVNRKGAVCLVCSTPIPFGVIRQAGVEGKLGRDLLAIVADGSKGPAFVSPQQAHIEAAAQATATWFPDTELTGKAAVNVPLYGLKTHGDLFTTRQLQALETLATLIGEVRDQIFKDALNADRIDDAASLEAGGSGAVAYAEAICTYLAFALGRLVDYSSTLATWNPTNENIRNVFQRQALAMTWDFAEANLIGPKLNIETAAGWVVDALKGLPVGGLPGHGEQLDATAALPVSDGPVVVSTDPPYYDNISYADISDYFYVWLRHCLNGVWPQIFSTVLTPKKPELTASPHRFGGSRREADKHFQEGFVKAFASLSAVVHPDIPMTVFYAYKQTEESDDSEESGFVSTGWEKMLVGLLEAGFQITATWPMRTTKKARSIARGTNALASAVVVACRLRRETASMATRRDFVEALQDELPRALRVLQQGYVAPVDLAQAAIGPGMAVFSRFARVIEADGSPMTVRTALELINQSMAEVLSELEDEFDSPTRWAISWFEQYSSKEGPFGEAEVLARAKGVGVNGLVQDGLIVSGRGKVRLLRPDELSTSWDPQVDDRLRVWEVTHHLVRALETGEEYAASILKKVGGSYGALARDLAYRLYNTCERKKWTQEALGYNLLVVAWPEIQRLAGRDDSPTQQALG